MSSNEELAVMIQQGQTRLYSELWGQTERFFKGCAYKYINKHGERLAASGIELDDLMQVSFLALYDAVQAFEPSTGYKLLTYTKYPLQSHFAELYGTRSAKRLPLNHCKSLDEPLTEETETTLLKFFQYVPRKLLTLDYLINCDNGANKCRNGFNW